MSTIWYVVGVFKVHQGLIATFPGMYVFLIDLEIQGLLNVWNGIQVVNTQALPNSIWKGSMVSCPPINLCRYGFFIPAAIKFTSLMYVLLYRRSKFCSLQKQGKCSIIKSICLVRPQCSMNNKFLLLHKRHEWANKWPGAPRFRFYSHCRIDTSFFSKWVSKNLKVRGWPH